ncbi:MAG: phosphatidylglycerophosphatase A [Bacteroidota bacterium]
MIKKIHKLIVTAFGAGYAPIAPGTMGALLACLLLWGVTYNSAIIENDYFQLGFFLVIVLTTLLGVWATQQLQAEWGEDPSKVVIDEVVGVWINLLFVPLNWQTILAGFVLFRFFDIAKPLGIRKMEAFENGWGVMLDDVLAGVYGNVVLQILLYANVIPY